MIDHFFFRLAAASLEQTLDFQRGDGLPFDRQAIAQTEKERCDGFHGLGVGSLVDTIEQWKILFLKMPRNRSLAAIMNSSMIRWAMLRSARTMFSGAP